MYMHNKTLLIIIFIFISNFSYSLANDSTVTVQGFQINGTNIYEGNNRNVSGWLGLPYAEPPVGDLRWKAPRDFSGFKSNFDAINLPSRCMQVSNTYDEIMEDLKPGQIIGNEDCLYLNVYRPDNIDFNEEKLPVMFWIHGGGNTWGYSASDMTTPKEFLNKHDVILVTVNYRLGPFGWLALNDFNNDSTNSLDQTYNFGTLDLVKALEWVNQNIEDFGGDKSNVTIFGESAGARNVMSLMVAPQSKDLFHRAISQSGYLNGDTLEEAINKPRAGSLEFVKNQLEIKFPNISKSEINEFILDNKKLESFLRSLSADEIISFYRVREGVGGLIDVPNSIPDGIVIPNEGLFKSYENGLAHDVPIIFGTNRDEHKLFMFDNPEFVKSKGFFFLEKIFDVLDFRYVPLDENYYEVYSKYMSMSWKIGGADDPADILNKYNKSHVYSYRFDWDEEPTFAWIDYAKYLGAAHGLEIPFIFDSINRTNLLSYILYDDDNIETDQELANQMGKYWTNFAYTGSPNSGPYNDLVEWKNWSKKSQQYIIFDSSNDQGIRMQVNTDSGSSLMQGLADETISTNQKCYIVDKIFVNTTLPIEKVDIFYDNFLDGVCNKI